MCAALMQEARACRVIPWADVINTRLLKDTQELLPFSLRHSRLRFHGFDSGNRRSRVSSFLGNLGLTAEEPGGGGGLEAVGFAVLVALGDVVDAAAALLGRQGRLVLLVHAQHVDADPNVLERVARELGDGRDQVREGRGALEVRRERVGC